MSRLRAGGMSVFPREVGLAGVVAHALADIGPVGRSVQLRIPDVLPAVYADPALLERVVVNLTANALRYAPAGRPPLLSASALAGRAELRGIDQGPGLPKEDRARAFVPFHRMGARGNSTRVG